MRLPTWKKSPQYPESYNVSDLANADRITLLLQWWEASGDQAFAELAVGVAEKPVGGFNSWRDGEDLVEIIKGVRFGYYDGFPLEEALLAALEDGTISLLATGLGSEELEKMSDAIIDSEDYVGPDVAAAVREAIQREFDDIERSAAETDSDSTLTDRIASLEKLALRGAVAPAVLTSAIETVNRRIAKISEETETAGPPSFSGATKPEIDKFDDAALANLFAPLLEPEQMGSLRACSRHQKTDRHRAFQ